MTPVLIISSRDSQLEDDFILTNNFMGLRVSFPVAPRARFLVYSFLCAARIFWVMTPVGPSDFRNQLGTQS